MTGRCLASGGVRPSPNCAAECFLQLLVIKGVELVRKIKTGLECDEQFFKYLRSKEADALLLLSAVRHSNYQFSQQPLTALEPRFNFSD